MCSGRWPAPVRVRELVGRDIPSTRLACLEPVLGEKGPAVKQLALPLLPCTPTAAHRRDVVMLHSRRRADKVLPTATAAVG